MIQSAVNFSILCPGGEPRIGETSCCIHQSCLFALNPHLSPFEGVGFRSGKWFRILQFTLRYESVLRCSRYKITVLNIFIPMFYTRRPLCLLLGLSNTPSPSLFLESRFDDFSFLAPPLRATGSRSRNGEFLFGLLAFCLGIRSFASTRSW